MEQILCPPIDIEIVKKQLKRKSPKNILELEICPMCNNRRHNGEDKCNNCGFFYVPVGFLYEESLYGGNGKDFINELFDEQRKSIRNIAFSRSAIITLIACVIISTLLYLFSVKNVGIYIIAAVLPSFLIGYIFGTLLNEPYKRAMEDLNKREHDYWRMQLKWKKMNNQKEQMKKQKEIEKYGEFKTMTIEKWRKQATHNKYFPYMNISVQESKITFYHEKGFIKYKNFFIKAADVIDCSLIDDGRGKVITKTEVKRKTSSVIGRAVVGQVVAGPVGAVIGGMTAKKKVENEEIEEHDYNIYITTTNINIPLLKLEFGENTENARKVYSMLKLTINTNK